MLISLKKGVGFISVPKCASTTIEHAFRDFCDVKMTGNPAIKHVKYRDVESHLFPFFSVYGQSLPYMFAVMRDPLDWLVSWYSFRSRNALRDPAHPHHGNYTGNMSFLDFIGEYCAPKPVQCALVGVQSDYLRNETGEIGVDQIVPLARVGSDVPDLLERFGISIPKLDMRRNSSPQLTVDPIDMAKAREMVVSSIPDEFVLYENTLDDE